MAGGLGVLSFAPIADSTISAFMGDGEPVPLLRVFWPTLGVLIGVLCFSWAISLMRRPRTLARALGGCVVLAIVTGAHASWGPPVYRLILLICVGTYLAALGAIVVYRRAEARGDA